MLKHTRAGPVPLGLTGRAHGRRNGHPGAAWEEITSLQGTRGTSLKKGFGVVGCQECKTAFWMCPPAHPGSRKEQRCREQADGALRRQHRFESPVQFPSASSRGEQAVTGGVCN